MTTEAQAKPAFRQIPADRVYKDNSNLWRHNRVLDSAVRKERFRKEDFDALRDYHEHQGILGIDSPHDLVELEIDLAKFKEGLSDRDSFIFKYTIEYAILNKEPIRQQVLASSLSISQPLVSIITRRLKENFSAFYFTEE